MVAVITWDLKFNPDFQAYFDAYGGIVTAAVEVGPGEEVRNLIVTY